MKRLSIVNVHRDESSKIRSLIADTYDQHKLRLSKSHDGAPPSGFDNDDSSMYISSDIEDDQSN